MDVSNSLNSPVTYIYPAYRNFSFCNIILILSKLRIICWRTQLSSVYIQHRFYFNIFGPWRYLEMAMVGQIYRRTKFEFSVNCNLPKNPPPKKIKQKQQKKQTNKKTQHLRAILKRVSSLVC